MYDQIIEIHNKFQLISNIKLGKLKCSRKRREGDLKDWHGQSPKIKPRIVCHRGKGEAVSSGLSI